jgi:hypothetical protein
MSFFPNDRTEGKSRVVKNNDLLQTDFSHDAELASICAEMPYWLLCQPELAMAVDCTCAFQFGTGNVEVL